MMITIMSIVRRQWVDYDRLTFPLLQLPIDMTEESKDGSIVSPFLKNMLMWIGFALPFCLFSTNALNHYFPFIPDVQLRNSVQLFNNALNLTTNVNFTHIDTALQSKKRRSGSRGNPVLAGSRLRHQTSFPHPPG